MSSSTSSTTANTNKTANSVNSGSTLPTIDTNLGNPIGVNQPGGPSHEVLANFFQSLLVKKASSSGSSPTTTLLGNSGFGNREEDGNNTPSTPTGTARRSTISRKDVHKELDRIRQYVNKP